jgi:predicted GNAT family N-acyltransferase
MAEKYGGGAESYARFKQYDYRAVSFVAGQLLAQQTLRHAMRGFVLLLLLLQSCVLQRMQSSCLLAGCVKQQQSVTVYGFAPCSSDQWQLH